MMFFGKIEPATSDFLSVIALFGIFALVVHKILASRGFFKLPSTPFDQRRWSLAETFVCFGIYFLCSYFLTPFLLIFFAKVLSSYKIYSLKNKVFFGAFAQSVNFSLLFICLGLYLSFFPISKVRAIWKDPSMKPGHSYFYDVFVGILTWFISFPVIIVINRSFELLNTLYFKKAEIDQVAVSVLKNSSTSLFPLIVSLIIIIFSAPIIEEFLFRGCLQNFLRPHLGKKGAIFLTSVLFGCLHYSSSQGITNIPLIATLTTFSLYLGFIYEKTRSLLSPMILHATFNTISALRILSM